MKCPLCSAEMVKKSIGEIEIDFCENGCHGVWFESFELARLDEKNEGCGEELEKILGTSLNERESSKKISCPNCNIPLHIHRYRAGSVQIDECYSCGGVFLDSGELKKIREQYKDSETIKAEIDNILTSVHMDVQSIAEMDEAMRQKYEQGARKRADKMSRLFKFIS